MFDEHKIVIIFEWNVGEKNCIEMNKNLISKGFFGYYVKCTLENIILEQNWFWSFDCLQEGQRRGGIRKSLKSLSRLCGLYCQRWYLRKYKCNNCSTRILNKEVDFNPVKKEKRTFYNSSTNSVIGYRSKKPKMF